MKQKGMRYFCICNDAKPHPFLGSKISRMVIASLHVNFTVPIGMVKRPCGFGDVSLLGQKKCKQGKQRTIFIFVGKVRWRNCDFIDR